MIANLAFNAILYHIWLEKNQRYLQNLSRQKDKIVDDIIFDIGVKAKSLKTSLNDGRLTFYINACWGVDVVETIPNQRYFTWPMPRPGFCVLSCDGSLEKGRAGYGGLLRNDLGYPIVRYSGLCSTQHVFWLEIFSLYRGVVITRERNNELDHLHGFKSRCRHHAHCGQLPMEDSQSQEEDWRHSSNV